MEVSGQLHAPAALQMGKQPPVTFGYKAEWAPETVWTRRREEKTPSLRLQGIEPRSFSP